MTAPPTTISRALAEYLTDWLAWVDRGAPDGEPYSRRGGLCSQCKAGRAKDELRRIFWSDSFPFNRVGKDYWQDAADRTQHLNEARLAWVRSTLATAEITE